MLASSPLAVEEMPRCEARLDEVLLEEMRDEAPMPLERRMLAEEKLEGSCDGRFEESIVARGMRLAGTRPSAFAKDAIRFVGEESSRIRRDARDEAWGDPAIGGRLGAFSFTRLACWRSPTELDVARRRRLVLESTEALLGADSRRRGEAVVSGTGVA